MRARFALAALGIFFVRPSWAARRNVVVVDICSARADHFGFHGYARPTTPGLDRLARESAVFDRALAQSSWCLPNYASLFTGHVAEVHGHTVNRPGPLPPFESPIAERLRDAGYATAGFAGGVYELPGWGLDKGFTTFENNFSTRTATPGRFADNFPAVEKWLGRHRGGPFFLYAAVDDLHAPYQSPDPDRFDPNYEGVVHDTDVIHVRFFRAYNGEGTPELAGKLAAFRADARGLPHIIAHYDASLAEVDRSVTAFLDRIKTLGLWDDTVVIVTADHGEMLGEHGLLGHTEGLYEPVLHVPLIIHHPDYPASVGQRLRQLVERVDLAPTILDSGGVDYADAELQGESLLPYLADPQRPGRPAAYASSQRNLATPAGLEIDERVLRRGRWKLIWYAYKKDFELYDLETDPREEHDLAQEKPEVVRPLAFELLRRAEQLRPHAPGLPSGKQEGSGAALAPPAASR